MYIYILWISNLHRVSEALQAPSLDLAALLPGAKDQRSAHAQGVEIHGACHQAKVSEGGREPGTLKHHLNRLFGHWIYIYVIYNYIHI